MDLPFVESFAPASRSVLADWRAGDAWLAGGTALFSEPAPDLRRLFDLTAFAWPPLTVSAEGLEIAATCTVAQLRAYTPPTHWSAGPLFKLGPEALLASWKVWHQATVGGNICLALPAGSITAVCAALDGVARIWTPDGGERRLAVSELVTGPSRTGLAPGELLRSVTIGPAALRSTVALAQASLSPRGRSAALVIGRRELTGATVITLTASVPAPVQLRFGAPPSPEELRRALEETVREYYDDVHGDPDWRAHLSASLAEQIRSELEANA